MGSYCHSFFNCYYCHLSLTQPFFTHSLLFLSKASHHEEFLGSLVAKVLEGVIPCVLRLAEVRAKRPVGPARPDLQPCSGGFIIRQERI